MQLASGPRGTAAVDPHRATQRTLRRGPGSGPRVGRWYCVGTRTNWIPSASPCEWTGTTRCGSVRSSQDSSAASLTRSGGSNVRVVFERVTAFAVVLDDRSRVTVGVAVRVLPRLVHRRPGQVPQFGHPFAHVVAVRVEAFA